MTTSDHDPGALKCPSALPSEPDAVVFGVVTGSRERPRIGYLTEAQPVTDELMSLAGSARPAQVFRMAATCMGGDCKHFDGANCRLVQRITEFLPPVVDGLPRCRIRSTCRWFRQEGREACVRCPQVVTEAQAATGVDLYVADPDAAAAPAP
jgi:hypothetical protein